MSQADERGPAGGSGSSSAADSLIRRRYLGRLMRSVSERRLAESLPSFEIEMRGRASEADWSEIADTLLESAKRASVANDMEVAWGLFLAATRVEILGYDDHEAKVHRAGLLREADDKLLKSWRGKAISEALADGDSAVDLHALRGATFIRDEAAANRWRRIALFRRQLLVLAGVLVLSLSAVLALALRVPLAVSDPPDEVGKRIWVYMAVFGALGGCLSAFRSIASSAETRVPDQARDLWLTASRPLVGAAGGLAALVLLGSDLKTAGPLLGLAFAAGFSEQLVARAVEAIDARSAKEPSAEDEQRFAEAVEAVDLRPGQGPPVPGGRAPAPDGTGDPTPQRPPAP